MDRPVPKFDFHVLGQAIKAARTERNESRKKVSDEMDISPRYLANIENKGQQPSLQIFFELVTRYGISVDEYFFSDTSSRKSTERRQLDKILDKLSPESISVVKATAGKLCELEKKKADEMLSHCHRSFHKPMHSFCYSSGLLYQMKL